MKTKILGLTVLSLLVASCGKENKVSAVPGTGSSTDAFTAGIVAQHGLPQKKDSIRYEYKKRIKTRDNLRCSYIVDKKIVVQRNDGANLKFRVSTSSIGANRNSVYCPFQLPNQRRNEISTVTHADYIKQTSESLNKALNPGVYCQANSSWCSHAFLLMQQDVTHHGIAAVLIEAEFHNKNGHIYNKKSYVSKTSLLQGVFEYEMRNTRTGRRVKYKTLKSNNRRRRPRR